MRQSIETIPGWIRLAASQTATIPLNFKETDSPPRREVLLMHHAKPHLALLCVVLTLAPAGSFAADQTAPPLGAAPPSAGPTGAAPQPAVAHEGFFGRPSAPYRGQLPPPVSLANSGRIESLLRAGNLYLSLQDTLADRKSTR